MMATPALPLRVRPAHLFVAAMVLLLAACSGSSASDDSAAQTTVPSQSRVIGPKEFASYIAANPDVPLINVHVPYEGHIEGTDSFVPFDRIENWEGLPADKDSPLAIYCRSGNMSATATETLAEMGYLNVVDLKGGMNAWTAAGYDLLRDQPSPG